MGDGIWASNLPDLGAGCAQATENALKIPGGRFPDWGPADVPTAGTTPAPGPGLGTAQPRAKRERLEQETRRGGAATRPGRPRSAVPASGRARVTAFAGRKRVGAGNDSAAANGTATVRVAFSRKAKRSLARRRAVRLNLRVEFKPTAGQTLRRMATVSR